MGELDTQRLSQTGLRLPDFLCIGAAKCGTTWLAKNLSLHPQLFVPAVKEVNFLDYDHVDARWDRYAKFYERAGINQQCGDLSVRYFNSKDAPKRVASKLPNIRVFAILRDPVAQINSHYHHLLKQNFHTGQSIKPPATLTEALSKYPSALWEPVRYGTHLMRWLQVVEKEQFRIFYYDDLRSDPESFVREVLGFIGVDQNFVSSALTERSASTRVGVSPKSEQGLQSYLRLYRGATRYVYNPMKRLLGRNAAEFLKRNLRIRELLARRYFQPGTQPVSNQDRQYIETKMQPELAILRQFAPAPLPKWLL